MSQNKNNNKTCDLIKKFSPEFIKMIDDTKKDNKERAANFCPTNGDVSISNICVGNLCSIPSLAASSIECKDKKAIGHIHTHPGLGIKYGEMSDSDILYSIATGEKFSCIGYRGMAKTVDCYDYPYGIPKEEAEKFKNMNFLSREKKFLEEINKYGTKIEDVKGVIMRKLDTPGEKWQKLKEEANFLTESKNNLLKYVNKTQEERLKNSCSLFLAPLEEEYLD